MATLTLVAGPNGSGKSTLTASISARDGTRVIDPDAIARSLNPDAPSRASIPAARQTILLSRALLGQQESFILESTLAGHGALSLLRDAKHSGYRTSLIYISLGDPELHIERVRLRVAQGGHDIPDADIRRRYARSLLRAPEAMRLADEAVIIDNAGSRPEKVAALRTGRISWTATPLPAWVLDLTRHFDQPPLP